MADLLGEKLISRTLRRFPKLKTVIVDHDSHAIGTKQLSDAFGPFRPADLLDAYGFFTLPTLITAMAASGINITEFNIGRRDNIFLTCEQVCSSFV